MKRFIQSKYGIFLLLTGWGLGLFVLLAQSAVLIKDASFDKNESVREELEEKIDSAFAMQPIGTSPDKIADLLVDAIIQIESGGNPKRVGAVGERGLMQIKKGTWQDMTRAAYGKALPFDRAFDPQLNERVGRLYLAHLQIFLQKHRALWRADERALLLASYNAGPARVKQLQFDVTKLPASSRDYVERATALHDYLLAQDVDYVHQLLLSSRQVEPTGVGL